MKHKNDDTTLILFGDSVIHDGMDPGGRMTLGWWWDPRQLGGVQASYLGLPSEEVRHYSPGRGDAILARPYFDCDTGLEDAELLAYPGLLSGWIDVRADMELQGAEVLLRRMAVRRPGFRLDFLAGYRYGRLTDRLTIFDGSTMSETLIEPPPPSPIPPSYEHPVGTVITVTDTKTERFDLFKSTNDFHGGDLGLVGRWTRGRWSLELLGKAALGTTSIRSVIKGGTSIATTTTETTITEEGSETTTGTQTRAYSGGLLALPSNIDYYSDSEFTVMSELGLSLRYELACDLWFSVGYNRLHWNRVGWAADQIHLAIDPDQIPPETWEAPEPCPESPRFLNRTTDFWAQGLNLRLEHQF